ncbi:MAG: hypothetical protein M0Z66_02870 [Thermaerobacter sp.]|nr:hypothetical protein [Thermaerobacter sp.]
MACDHRHDNPWTQQQQLARKLQGYYQYFALWNTARKLNMVRRETEKYWLWALKSRSQRRMHAWEDWKRRPWFRLPDPKVLNHTV